MKRKLLLPLLSLLFILPVGAWGQASTLSQGDIAIIAVNPATTDYFTIVFMRDVAAGTVINFTDNGFTAGTTGRTGEGFLTFTAPAIQTAGTVLTWTNGMNVSGTGWNSNNPSNMAFNASGDQLFAFQGSTGNWGSQSGITLLYGVNYGTPLSGTSSASNTVQPTNLSTSTGFINLSATVKTNSYFANQNTASGSVSVTNTPSSLLTSFLDSSKWFGNGTNAATLPSYTIKVLAPNTTTQPSITFGTVTSSSIVVNFTGGNGSKRILLIHSGSAVNANPVDGTGYTAAVASPFGTQIGTGNYVVYNSTGTTATITGLSPNTTYHFAVYSFNDSVAHSATGTENYLTTSPGTNSQTTDAPVYTWNVASGNWSTSTSWTPTRSSVTASDVLKFDGSTQATPIVTVDVNETVGQVWFINNVNATLQTDNNARTLILDNGVSGADFRISSDCSATITNTVSDRDFTINITSGETGTIDGTLTFTATGSGTSDEHKLQAADASAITVSSTGVVIAGTAVDQNVFGDGSQYGSNTMAAGQNSVIFQSGSTYRHQGGQNPFGFTDPSSAVTFQSGSNYIFEAATGQPAFGNRTYGNLEINSASTGMSNMTATNAFTINGNLTLTSAGSAVSFDQTGGGSISGNISIAGGQTLGFNPASAATFSLNASGAQSISSTGSFSIGSNANITVGGLSTLSIGRDLTIPSALTINGKVSIGNQTLTLGGTLAGSGTIVGSNASNLTVNGTGAFGTINMDQTIPNTTDVLNNFTFNRTSGGTLSLGVSNTMRVTGIVTPTAGILTTNGKLTLKATSATSYGQIDYVASGGSISGNVTGEFILPSSSGGRWRNISSPFTGNTINDLADDIYINYGSPSYIFSNVWRLDESVGGLGQQGAWVAVGDSSQSMDSEGFGVYLFSENMNTDKTVDLTGTYLNGASYTTPALGNNAGAGGDTAGYHLIRNPWPSNYIHTGTVTNLSGNMVYVYQGGIRRDWDGNAGSLSNGVIPPYHAFMVKAISTGTLTFPAANRTTGNSASYNKTSLSDYVTIKITDPHNEWDETRIYSDTKAQNGPDEWDGHKMLNDADYPSLYTVVDGNKTSINHINAIPANGISFPVVFSSQTEGQHTISFTAENITPGFDIVLEDKLLSKFHNAAQGNYTFAHLKANNASRFVIHYKKAGSANTSVNELANNKVYVGSNSNTVSVSVFENRNYTAAIYDITGRMVSNTQAIEGGSKASTITLNGVSAGYYIVNVYGENVNYTTKVFLQ